MKLLSIEKSNLADCLKCRKNVAHGSKSTKNENYLLYCWKMLGRIADKINLFGCEVDTEMVAVFVLFFLICHCQLLLGTDYFSRIIKSDPILEYLPAHSIELLSESHVDKYTRCALACSLEPRCRTFDFVWLFHFLGRLGCLVTLSLWRLQSNVWLLFHQAILDVPTTANVSVPSEFVLGRFNLPKSDVCKQLTQSEQQLSVGRLEPNLCSSE